MVAHCSAPDPHLFRNLFPSSTSSSFTILSLISILIHILANTCLVESSSSSSSGNFSSSSSPLSSYASRVRMPFIAEHPEDVTIGEDEPTTLNCKADGSPNPKIEWYKDGELLRSTGNRMTLSSGSLFFLHVISEKDTGVYWCTASNIAGTAISRKATLILKSSSISSSSSSSSSSFVTSTPTHHHSHHRKGSSSTAAERHIVVKSPPVKPPSDLMLKVFDKHSALLSWSPPRRQTPQHHHNGHNKHLQNQIPISGYRVFLRSLETGSETSVEQSNITTDSSTLSVMLNNLSPELTYEVSVSAFNSEGLGPFSTPLLLRTDPMDGVLSRRTQTKDRLNFAKDPLKQPWFFTLIGVTVFLVMSPCILFFLIRYRKYDAAKGSKKCAKSSHIVSEHHQQLHPHHHPLSTQHINESNSAFGGVWIDRSCYYGSSPGNTDRRRDKMNLTSVQRSTIDSCHLPDHESIYSSIEPDYAEVSDNNFVSFHKSHPFHSSLSAARHPKLLSSNQQQQQQHHNSMSRGQHQQQQQQNERPTTPGPYATTNLINIIPNSLYRDLD